MTGGVKGQLVHLALLGVASVVALGVWTRDDQAQLALKPSEVEVWGGSPDSVTELSFESPTRKVRIEPKKDALGRWYVGTVDKDEPSFVHPPPGAAADAGAPPSPTKHETLHFISVKTADELLKTLAPLHALRAVGKIEGTRAEEFGLDKPDGTLKMTIAGKPQSLVIGSATPGGSERYAKSAAGDVYAISGDIVQSLLFAESRLAERDLQDFKPEEVTNVKILKGGKSRDLSRVPDKVEGWADAATPTKLDETAGNWMAKLGRLHVQDWVEKPSAPVGPDNTVVSVAYFAGKKPLGTLDLYKVPGEKGSEYVAKTAYGRWYAKVVTSTAEQVEQDSGSVVK
ncbi:MAG TPA: DUF4340 domain-containing protein [Polyangiaceae bacterium]|jgi:hypothetical protein|nr:DUF4340 domain-containing protein [Polyangiaceae bacterium]